MSNQPTPSNQSPQDQHQPSQPEPAPNASETLSPNDHLELLIELMRPGSIELARRWVSALMLVPETEREAIVNAIEAQIVADYCD